VLRMTVFRKFEHSCFVGSLVVKIPACAKPQTVGIHYEKTKIKKINGII